MRLLKAGATEQSWIKWRINGVPIICTNRQECKTGFLWVLCALWSVNNFSICLSYPHGTSSSPPPLLLYCSLAKRWLSGCATWKHVHHETASVWASTRVGRWGQRRRAGQKAVFHSCHRCRCAESRIQNPPMTHFLLCLVGRHSAGSLGRKMWLWGCLIQLGPRIHGENGSNGEMNSNASSAQKQIFLFT